MQVHPQVDTLPVRVQPVLPELSMTFHTPSALLAAEKVALSLASLGLPESLALEVKEAVKRAIKKDMERIHRMRQVFIIQVMTQRPPDHRLGRTEIPLKSFPGGWGFMLTRKPLRDTQRCIHENRYALVVFLYRNEAPRVRH